MATRSRPTASHVSRIGRLACELVAVPFDLEAAARTLLAVELPTPQAGSRSSATSASRRLGEVAGVVHDVQRRVDEPLDDPREAVVEALEQLGLFAEQPRSW
jgi:hypothetical protein